MTGFQFGRKLGDWGKEEDPQAQPGKVSSNADWYREWLTQYVASLSYMLCGAVKPLSQPVLAVAMPSQFVTSWFMFYCASSSLDSIVNINVVMAGTQQNQGAAHTKHQGLMSSCLPYKASGLEIIV